MNLVIYGPEGSGKGTQAKLLSNKLALPVYTAGDLVREAAKNSSTTLGKMARKVLSQGTYLPDNLMCEIIKRKILENKEKKGFILDGFPRTYKQAKFLMELFDKKGLKLDKMIYLRLSDEESVKRLLKRKRKLFTQSRLLHDTPVKIKQRLNAYYRQEKDILKFFKSLGLLLEINGEQNIEQVFSDILKGLNITP